MFLKAPEATLAAKRRLSQATDVAKPMALPTKPYANTLPAELCRFPQLPPNTPMHSPKAAGVKALRTDFPRNGLSGFPLRNASRPERAPASPELRSFRP